VGFNSPSSRLQYNAMLFTGLRGNRWGEGGVCSLLPIASASVSTTTLDCLVKRWLAERMRIAQELYEALRN
jgi:hypothetical protein